MSAASKACQQLKLSLSLSHTHTLKDADPQKSPAFKVPDGSTLQKKLDQTQHISHMRKFHELKKITKKKIRA
jgi:hypothetical protein